jgi:probable rRNA maturation factor
MTPRLRLHLTDPDSLPLSRPRIRRLLLASLDATCQSAEITVATVGRAQGRQLNRDHRGQDHATNILTFALEPLPHLQADLVLCMPVLIAEARQQGKPLVHHLAHLLVHGALHACGLDHQTDDEAEDMEALERRILMRFRIPDPYGTLSPVATSHAPA